MCGLSYVGDELKYIRTAPLNGKPIKCLDITEPLAGDSLDALIPKRKKPGEKSNDVSNGVISIGLASARNSDIKSVNKRTASDGGLEGSPIVKRPKKVTTEANGTNGTSTTNGTTAVNDTIVLDDDNAIVIDDD